MVVVVVAVVLVLSVVVVVGVLVVVVVVGSAGSVSASRYDNVYYISVYRTPLGLITFGG